MRKDVPGVHKFVVTIAASTTQTGTGIRIGIASDDGQQTFAVRPWDGTLYPPVADGDPRYSFLGHKAVGREVEVIVDYREGSNRRLSFKIDGEGEVDSRLTAEEFPDSCRPWVQCVYGDDTFVLSSYRFTPSSPKKVKTQQTAPSQEWRVDGRVWSGNAAADAYVDEQEQEGEEEVYLPLAPQSNKSSPSPERMAAGSTARLAIVEGYASSPAALSTPAHLHPTSRSKAIMAHYPEHNTAGRMMSSSGYCATTGAAEPQPYRSRSFTKGATTHLARTWTIADGWQEKRASPKGVLWSPNNNHPKRPSPHVWPEEDNMPVLLVARVGCEAGWPSIRQSVRSVLQSEQRFNGSRHTEPA